MRNLFKQTMLVAGFMLATASANAAVNLCAGTMTTGGSAAFTIGNPPVGVLFDQIAGDNMGIDVNLDFGYFIIDNLELGVNLLSTVRFSSPAVAGVGIGIGAQYYFDLGSMIYPYIGTHPGISWAGVGSVSVWNFRVPVELGMIIGLNEHVALDVGATAGLSWDLTNGTGTRFDLAVGHLGVRAYF